MLDKSLKGLAFSREDSPNQFGLGLPVQITIQT
jgi:hypothetical protein